MAPKPKNIIIFVAIAIIFSLIYIFFIKSSSDDATSLVSSGEQPSSTLTDTGAPDPNSLIAKDFLSLLLNVKTIKLNDSIFSNIAFLSLHDSSIILIPDGTEGRPNPFAPIGIDSIVVPVNTPTP